MKTLYLSDLDGTLLHSNAQVSDYTTSVVNRVVQSGGLFSYATGRSHIKAAPIIAGLNIEIPVICHNGALTFDRHGKMLSKNLFTRDEVDFIASTMNKHDILPIIYAYINGVNNFSYIKHHYSGGMRKFLDDRINNPRRREVHTLEELFQGDVFDVICIEEAEKLDAISTAFSMYSDSITYGKDFYSDDLWFEMTAKNATKGIAALELKSMLACDKLVVFGDNMNDISMFSVADECYATANAVHELKEIATAVIESNDDDGVAKWLEKNVLI